MFNNYYKGKRVLVTGHTGFKGSWMCLWLNQLGARIAGFSDRIPTEPSHFEAAKISDLLDRDTRADIADNSALEKCISEFKPEIIFHLAAEPIVRTCFEDPRLAFQTNLMGTVNVLDIGRKHDFIKSIVLITSDKCYENVEWTFGYRENDQLGGKDPYSASKACAELAASAFYRSFYKDLSTAMCTVRAGNVIGGGDWAANRIVPDCVRAWSEGQSVQIRSPKSTRPWQHVLEPLSGYLWLGALLGTDERKALNGEPYNFGPAAEGNFTVEQLINEMQKSWGEAKFHQNSDHVADKKEAGLLKLCCDKANHRLRWRPALSFEQTAELTVNWYKKYYETKECREQSLHDIEVVTRHAAEHGIEWAQ